MKTESPRWMDTPLRWRSMTPEEVHRTICDVVRLMSGGEAANEQGDSWFIDADKTIDTLFLWMDDAEPPESPDELKALLDVLFDVKLPMTSLLEAMLNSPERYTIGDLCKCLAHDLAQVDVEPARILGNASHEATVFRIMRRHLAKCGADVGGIKPSSCLEPYLKEHGQKLWLLASRLAPGALSARVTAEPYPVACAIERVGLAMWMIGFLSIIGWGFKSVFPFVPSMIGTYGLAAVIAAVVIIWIANRIPVRSYRWGEMETFADACSAIAAGIRARRS